MNWKDQIETQAREILVEIWDSKNVLWPNKEVHPIDMLDPRVAAHVLGIDFQTWPDLPLLTSQRHSEVAGLIDRNANKIAVSTKFSSQVQRFTSGHEIGHWLLHKDEVMLRDRPIEGLSSTTYKKPWKEKEADHFSACLLMPRKLVIEQFERTFRRKTPITIDDNVAFWLSPDDHYSLLHPNPKSLECELAIANATSFEGRHIRSLAEQFKVSGLSMAIRLKKLELVKY
ncbi:MAG: ImmA/IrrE family metallo-endopeptidase [Candidatus Thiodiazotropha lotti]|nr:ImmA/IrrE family metallo-endopeptidase [Candidatus Thiodiazotropha lotti]